MNELISVDPDLLLKWDVPVPRYTSYPTAPQFKPMEADLFKKHLQLFDQTQKPLSLYIHIPFCRSMCLFCGCSVVLNRNPERQQNYLDHLLKEIEKVSGCFVQKRLVTQLHLGGGTPTSLSEEQFAVLMEKIRSHFLFSPDAEISIEIDPRTVFADGGKKLSCLKELGFNRVSFGVQDLDPKVQEAVKRHQTEEMTLSTYYKAREIGFSGINIDLIYGLPFQTVESFAKTVEKLIEIKPDRIALYSYAKVPWLKPHQKAIDDETLPGAKEKLAIYVEARCRLMKAGFIAIGMDHFSSPSDSIAKAYRDRTLTRNFQGYSVAMAEDMIGFGVSSIGYIENGYFQNEKDLPNYLDCIAKGNFPLQRGYLLNEDDLIRRRAIQEIMCRFEVDKKEFAHLANLEPLVKEGFLQESDDKYIATGLGRLFVRLIASAFDTYLTQGKFSKAI
jgi:oxygen-independent coproporphyrinogen-3 oxidase